MGVSRVRPGPFQNTYSGGFLARIFERGVNNWAQSPEIPAGGELQRNQNHVWDHPWFWEFRSQTCQDFENHSILPHGIGGGLQAGPPYSDTARVPGGLGLLVPLLTPLRSGGHFNY